MPPLRGCVRPVTHGRTRVCPLAACGVADQCFRHLDLRYGLHPRARIGSVARDRGAHSGGPPMPTLMQRPATDADLDLIYQILSAAIGPYVERTFGPWDDVDQRGRFDAVWRPANHSIVELDGQPIGLKCVTITEEELYFVRL